MENAMNQNGSGVDYPTIDVGGKLCILKFTRGAFVYRIQKSGIDFLALGDPSKWKYADLIDLMHSALGNQVNYSIDELCEIFPPERSAEMFIVLTKALVKAFPPASPPAPQQPEKTGTAEVTALQ